MLPHASHEEPQHPSIQHADLVAILILFYPGFLAVAPTCRADTKTELIVLIATKSTRGVHQTGVTI